MSSQIQIPPQHGFTSNKIRTLTIDNSQHKFLAGGGGVGLDLTHMTAFWVREESTNSVTGGVWHGTRMGRGGKEEERGGGGYTFVLSNTRLHALQLT